MPAHLTSIQKGRLLALRDLGWSARRIAGDLGCAASTVMRWINRMDQEGHTDRVPGSGRPECLIDVEKEAIYGIAVGDPFTSVSNIQTELGLACSTKTVTRALRSRGLRSSMSARKDQLTMAHKLERLVFAMDHMNWTVEQWRNVLFSDESMAQIGHNHKVRVLRPPGSRFDERFVQICKRSGRFSVPVWGCVSSSRLGALHRINGYLDGQQYKDILEHVMLPEAYDNHFPDGRFTFQHDKSPIHESNLVKRWLNTRPDILVLDWPRRGPDMSPIENIWSKVKSIADLRDINSPDELWAEIHRCWLRAAEDHEYLETLWDSMPRRMHAVCSVDGYWSKY